MYTAVSILRTVEEGTGLILGVHAQRGLQYLVSVCVSVCLSVISNLASRATTHPTRNTNGFSVAWTVN